MLAKITTDGSISWREFGCTVAHQGWIIEICFNSDDTHEEIGKISQMVEELAIATNKTIVVTPCSDFQQPYKRMQPKKAREEYQVLVQTLPPGIVSMPFAGPTDVDVTIKGRSHLFYVN